jgi:hypothetical protein
MRNYGLATSWSFCEAPAVLENWKNPTANLTSLVVKDDQSHH